MKTAACLCLLVVCFAAPGWTTRHSDSSLTPPATVEARPRETQQLPETFVASTVEASSVVPLKLPLVEPKIVVIKSTRRLELYAGGKVVRTYPVALGFEPVGDKARQGDGRTPEGDFYIYTKNDKSAYYLSLGLSYPNEEDAARGLRDGLISQAQYERIRRALRRKTAPPQNTALGGLIFIHGHGTQRDWTLGCVALEDENIKELFAAVPVGTIVTIKP